MVLSLITRVKGVSASDPGGVPASGRGGVPASGPGGVSASGLGGGGRVLASGHRFRELCYC